MMNPADLSWSFIQGYYYPKFLNVVKNMEWDERYQFLKTIYDDKNPKTLWETRSEEPIQDMMERLFALLLHGIYCSRNRTLHSPSFDERGRK